MDIGHSSALALHQHVKVDGSITALVTPFTEEGVDAKAFAEFVAWQIAEGTEGLVPCGTTGEAPTLTPAERERLIQPPLRSRMVASLSSPAQAPTAPRPAWP